MRVLVFAPHAALWTHAFPEALTAEALRQSGHEITYVGCGRRLQDFCVPMSAHGLRSTSSAEDRNRVCEKCQRNDAVLRRQFGFAGPTLSDLSEPEDGRLIDAMMSVGKDESLFEIEHDGIPLGRIALYELMLRSKRMDLDLTKEDWHEYRIALRNTIAVALASERLLDRVRPDRVIVYNSLYSALNVICRKSRQRGIPQYFLHAGSNLSNRLQTLMVGREDAVDFQYQVADEWPRFAHVPATQRVMTKVTDHVLQLLAGRNVFAYSKATDGAPAGVRQRYGIPSDAKLLVAALSSNDELTALRIVGAMPQRTEPLFESQVEWVRHLVDYVAGRKDRFLLVRVHPREFPNRRESQRSQHATLLKEALSKLPENAKVNWPDDEISLYDLVEETDVFLTAWSSVGRELPLLGVPVVSYAPGLLFYATSLNYTASTRDGYVAAVEQALSDGWSLERARAAYRWTAFEFTHSLLDISDSYKEIENEDFSKKPLIRRLVDGIGRRIDQDYRQNSDCRHRRSRMAAADTINEIFTQGASSVVELLDPAELEQGTLKAETAALRIELTRIADVLYPTQEARAASKMYKLMTEAREG